MLLLITDDAPFYLPPPVHLSLRFEAMSRRTRNHRKPAPPASPAEQEEDLKSVRSASDFASDTSTELRDLESLTLTEDDSMKARDGDPTRSEELVFDYDEVEWARIPGFTVPVSYRTSKLKSGVWKHGVPTEKAATKERYWLCLQCHKDNDKSAHHVRLHDGSVTNVHAHLKRFHKIDLKTPMPPPFPVDAHNVTNQEMLAECSKAWNEYMFQRKLVRWIVYHNVAFKMVDCEVFRDFIRYIAPRAEDAMPSSTVVRDWIMRGYRIHQGLVKQKLQSAVSKIHFAFDMWTSSNYLSLNAVVAHFIDEDFKPQALLLAIPKVEGKHTGANISSQVIKVIEDFGIEAHQVGYFIIDNASNNDTAICELAEHFGFGAVERRIRCAGHVINLIARSLLFGYDKQALENELMTVPDDLKEDLRRWRQAGPVGRLHNLIEWIYASAQRVDRWKECKL